MTKQGVIATDLIGVFVKCNARGAVGTKGDFLLDGTVRGVFLDADDKVKLLVQDEDGRLLDLYAETQVVVCRDYRGVPERQKARRV